MIYDIYFLTAVGLTPGGSSTVHIYTQTIHRTFQNTNLVHNSSTIYMLHYTPRHVSSSVLLETCWGV